jgi:hypothetical protein
MGVVPSSQPKKKNRNDVDSSLSDPLKMLHLTTHDPQQQSQLQDEDDWEKAWAEDSESDEEEEPSDDTAVEVASATAAASLRIDAVSPTGHTVGQHFRPDLDSGFAASDAAVSLSDAAGMDMGATVADAAVGYFEEDQMQQQQQQQQQSPDLNNLQPQEGTDQILTEDWEGYHHEIQDDSTKDMDMERPCVDMFDPALRVLGRGSFGRVSVVSMSIVCFICIFISTLLLII